MAIALTGCDLFKKPDPITIYVEKKVRIPISPEVKILLEECLDKTDVKLVKGQSDVADMGEQSIRRLSTQKNCRTAVDAVLKWDSGT